MIGIEARHAHADATAWFVVRFGIDELLVMRVVHAEGDEGGLALCSTTIDEDFHDVTAVEHELTERIRLLLIALFDPCVVLLQVDHLARPHRHHAESGLEEMSVHKTGDLIDRGFDHFFSEGFTRSVEGTHARGDVGRVVAVEHAERCLGARFHSQQGCGGEGVEEMAALHESGVRCNGLFGLVLQKLTFDIALGEIGGALVGGTGFGGLAEFIDETGADGVVKMLRFE